MQSINGVDAINSYSVLATAVIFFGTLISLNYSWETNKIRKCNYMLAPPSAKDNSSFEELTTEYSDDIKPLFHSELLNSFCYKLQYDHMLDTLFALTSNCEVH